MLFSDLRLAEPILRSIESEKYTTPTPIQAQAIPHALNGRDILGSAQTGTGKTAAFALPILHKLSTNSRPVGRGVVRALVLSPTRELAVQTADAFRVYGKNLHLKYSIIYGGVGQTPQVHALRQGVDVCVATPGRLMDLMEQGHVDLRSVEVLVLDEADRMLDMGFIHDIRRICAKMPASRQTLFFSATMPREIKVLADALLKNPEYIAVAPVATTADGVNESVYFISKDHKASLLAHLYNDLPMARTIVFTRTKRGADRVVKRLHASGIKAEAIHGDKSQNSRERALHNFRINKTPILVATDIASRGIDVDGITHVVNYDLTHEPETYVHRIGRTARAGASGAAVSFCDKEEMVNLKAIEKLIRRKIPVKTAADFTPVAAPRTAGHHESRTRPADAERSHQPKSDRHPSRGERGGHDHTPRESRGKAHGKPAHASPAHDAAKHTPAAKYPLSRPALVPGAGVIHRNAQREAQRSAAPSSLPIAHRKGPPPRTGTSHGRPAGRKRAY